MTVKELIVKLQEHPEDAIVILSLDSEGNSYDTLHTVGECCWDATDKQIGLLELTEFFKDAGYTEEDLLDGVPAVCLWP